MTKTKPPKLSPQPSALSPQSSALSAPSASPREKSATIPVEYLPAAQSIEERADRVGQYYHAGKRSAARLVVFNVLAGIELLGIRETIVHGQFLKWCDSHLPEGMSYRSANYFMGLAEALLPKFATIANLDFKRLQITNGDLSDPEIKPFAEAVQEVTNGKAYTDLLREYGLMATPQKQKHNPPRLTPDQLAADRQAGALIFADGLIAELATFDADPQLHADLRTPKLKELHDAILTSSRHLRDLLKSRKSTTAKKSKKKGGKK